MKLNKITYLIGICVILIGVVGCAEYLPNIRLPQSLEYKTYKNFDLYKSNFETAVDIVELNGTGLYYMYDENGGYLEKRKDKEEGEIVYKHIDIPLNDSEREAVKNIVENSYMGSISYIAFNDDDEKYVLFFEEQQGCGVVYTENIEAFLRTRTKDYYYNMLSENWYAIYR